MDMDPIKLLSLDELLKETAVRVKSMDHPAAHMLLTLAMPSEDSTQLATMTTVAIGGRQAIADAIARLHAYAYVHGSMPDKNDPEFVERVEFWIAEFS